MVGRAAIKSRERATRLWPVMRRAKLLLTVAAAVDGRLEPMSLERRFLSLSGDLPDGLVRLRVQALLASRIDDEKLLGQVIESALVRPQHEARQVVVDLLASRAGALPSDSAVKRLVELATDLAPEDRLQLLELLADSDEGVRALLRFAADAEDEELTYRALGAIPPYSLVRNDLKHLISIARTRLKDVNDRARIAAHVATASSRLSKKFAEDILKENPDASVSSEIVALLEFDMSDASRRKSLESRIVEYEALHSPAQRINALLTTLYLATPSDLMTRAADGIIVAAGDLQFEDEVVQVIERLGISVPGGPTLNWPAAFDLVKSIKSQPLRAKGLDGLAFLDNALWGRGHSDELLDAALQLTDPSAKAWAIAGFGYDGVSGGVVDGEAWEQLVEASIMEVTDPLMLSRARRRLVRHDQEGPELRWWLAIDAGRAIEDPWDAVRELEAIVELRRAFMRPPDLTDQVVHMALDISESIRPLTRRTKARSKLASFVSDNERDEILIVQFEMILEQSPQDVPNLVSELVTNSDFGWRG